MIGPPATSHSPAWCRMDKCTTPLEGWWCTGPVCLVGPGLDVRKSTSWKEHRVDDNCIYPLDIIHPNQPRFHRNHLRIGRQENNDSAKSSLWLWSWKAQAFVPLFMMGLNPWMGILDQIITYPRDQKWLKLLKMVFVYIPLCLCTPTHNKVGNRPSSFHVPTLNTKYTTNDKS